MNQISLIALILILLSCEKQTVKYSGLNDLVVGAQQVVLYENGEFYLELGAGGNEGTFKIINDTVYLEYFKKPENWPDKLLITDEYFSTIMNDGQDKPIKIRRRTKGINKTSIDTIFYQSEPNGLAEINLVIIPNGDFDFYMRTIPQPMDEDDTEIISNLSGEWTKKENWIRLNFTNDELILDALFDKKYAIGNEFKIIDKSKIDINTELPNIHIWGVNCVKKN